MLMMNKINKFLLNSNWSFFFFSNPLTLPIPQTGFSNLPIPLL